MKLETELPRGSLKQPGRGFNAKSNASEVASTTAIQNRPDELEERFFRYNPATLLNIHCKDGGEVRMNKATAPYTPDGLIVVARRPGLERLPKDQPVKAYGFSDYPEGQQMAYLSVMENAVKVYQEKLGPDYIIFTGGNWLKNYSNWDERTSRSIGELHDHLCAVKKKGYVTEYENGGLEGNEVFTRERDLTNRLVKNGIKRIRKALPEESPLELIPRKNLPYGYSFIIPASADIKTFARLMVEHHDAYTSVAETMSSRYETRYENIITQPSYQMFMEIDDEGNRHISISPSFAGPIGVLESAGVQSLRHPSYDHLVDPKDQDVVQRYVASKLKDKLASQFTISPDNGPQLIKQEVIGDPKDELHDKEWLTKFTQQVFTEAELIDSDGRTIDGSSRLCFHVNRIAADRLRERGIDAQFIDYDRRERSGHSFINIPGYPNYLVDFQYKQFLPEGGHAELPDYLILPYRNEEELTIRLLAAGVPESRHWNWKEELFREERPSSNYATSLRGGNYARI